MQLSSGTQIPDGLLAAMTLLNEKPRLGVPSKNPAPNQGIDERNSTAAIGMRLSERLNSVGQSRRARYYASSMGRWMSPDWADKPEAVPYSSLDNPQSLNLYGYVNNNPLSMADADGHEGCCLLDQIDEVVKPLVESAEGALTELGGGAAVAGSARWGLLAGPALYIGAMIHPATVGQSDAAEIAQRDANIQQNQEHQAAPAEPQTSSGGAMKGGGRNGQKVNADRAQSAKDKISDLKGQRDALASKANKTPADKKELQKIDNQIKQQQTRMKPSENHSQKGKGQQ